MSLKTENKIVLITGTSSGFGKSIAEYLTTQHYTVIGTSRKEVAGSNYPVYQLDICSDESVKHCVAKVEANYGRIDVLINNAGIGISGAIEDTSIEEAKMQMETNFFGAFRMIRAVLPLMRKQNEGLIVNISSLGGLIGLPYQGFYCASKFAIEGLTEALRLELSGSNISVTNINPGDYNTAFTSHRLAIQQVENSVHHTQYTKTMAKYEHDEMNGGHPVEVAHLVAKLINRPKNLKVRYLSGKFMQKFAVFMKAQIGSRMFEQIMRSEYAIKK